VKPPGKRSIDACRACDLWRRATQGVPGAGARTARILLVGEQPGDEEDQRGKPFIGPAGRLLDELLAEAQIDRASVFVTNAVKHFKWEPRGRRRLHKRPNAGEIRACNPWLQQEIAALAPRVIVCLGATAARGVLGKDVPVAASSGSTMRTAEGTPVRVTWHPSALLRARYAGDEAPLHKALLADLKAALRLASKGDAD
jgi:DNA polymerase